MSDSIVQSTPAAAMRSFIQRVATGPALSKDLTLEETRLGMRLILEGEADPVQAGIFLIALRMKRETDDETKGMLEAIREATLSVAAPVAELVDIADPYDGCNRTLPASPFLPAVLAACGAPAVSHGVPLVGPKYGVTHWRVLKAAGVRVDAPPSVVAERVGNPDIAWGYVDQSRFCPSLYALADFRTLIVKRPAITTVEVMAGAITGTAKTHLVTGYVHKPYPRIYAMLARHAGFSSALLVRGVEGGVVPSLRQTGKCYYYRDGGEEHTLEVDPSELDIHQDVRAAPLPGNLPKVEAERDRIGMDVDPDTVAAAAAQAGLDALQGASGPTRDALVYAGALCLWHLGRQPSLQVAAHAVRTVLDSGRALSHFRAATSSAD